MANDNVKLKPCPFCGAFAEILYGKVGFTSVVKVICSDCGASTVNVESSLEYCAKDKAVELWNRRADDEQRNIIPR